MGSIFKPKMPALPPPAPPPEVPSDELSPEEKEKIKIKSKDFFSKVIYIISIFV